MSTSAPNSTGETTGVPPPSEPSILTIEVPVTLRNKDERRVIALIAELDVALGKARGGQVNPKLHAMEVNLQIMKIKHHIEATQVDIPIECFINMSKETRNACIVSLVSLASLATARDLRG